MSQSSSSSSSGSRRVGAKGKIAQVLAQARASVDMNGEYRGPPGVSLNEPSRPFTPASMDSRMTNLTDQMAAGPGHGFSRRGGAVAGGVGASPRMSGRDKLNPMTKMTYKRTGSSSLDSTVDSQPQRGKEDYAFPAGSAGGGGSLSLGGDLSPDASPAAEEYASICRDVTCDMAIITARLEDSTEEAALECIARICGPVQDLSAFIKKYPDIVFGDSQQCMHKLLMWLTSTFNTSQHDDVRHVICRYLFRVHIAIYTVTMTTAVAETLPIILKDIYTYFKRANTGEGSSSPVEQELFKLDIDVVLDFLRMSLNTVDVNCANSGFSFVPSSSDGATPPGSGAPTLKRKDSKSLPAGVSVSAVAPETMTKLLLCAEYASGCVKEYSLTSRENRRRLLHLDVVAVISHSLQKIVALREFLDSKYPRMPTSVFSMTMFSAGPPEEDLFQKTLKLQINQMEQNAVQLIAALRNFSLDESGREQLLNLHVMPLLCRVTRCSVSRRSSESNDVTSELLLSIARVTAKLSLYEDFREQINRSRQPVYYLESIVQLVLHEASLCDRIMEGSDDVDWPSWLTWPLLSRAAFTLGNFTTTNDHNRLLIAVDCNCLNGLIKLLQTCAMSLMALTDSTASEAKQSGDDSDSETDAGGDTKGAERELADATLKMLRLLANLCIHETPGNRVAKQSSVLELLQNLLIVSSNSVESEELLLNAIATSTNIGFFACRNCDSNREIDSKWEELLIGVSVQVTNFLFHDNSEIVAESLRALGNFTRVRSMVQRLCRIRGDEAIVLLLGHGNSDVAAAAAGVLVNITGFFCFYDDALREGFAPDISLDPETPVKLSAAHLTSILRKSSVSDILFLTLVLQVFDVIDKCDVLLVNSIQYVFIRISF
jgi:hypothetical protein